jgi:DNA-binding NtrC family response regulator
MAASPLIAIGDDDASIRDARTSLLRAAGWSVSMVEVSMAASTEALDYHRITHIRDKFTEGRHALEAQHGTPHGFEEIISPPGGIRPRESRGRSIYPADGCGGYGMSEADAIVFVVDDDPGIRDSLASLLRSVGLAVETFGSAQEFCNRQPPDGPACLVLDVRLPGLSGLELQQELAKNVAPMPIIFITGHGDIPMTVRAMKAGALEFLTKPFHDEDLLTAVAQALHCARQMAPGQHTPAAATPDAAERVRSDSRFAEIIGTSAALRRVLQDVETVAPTDATVLLLGETGTGKEVIARAIHRLSRRSAQAFVKLNCAAIPTGLLESELFGHEKGAFTGAIAQRIGRFELAHRGSIFLDEVGEIPLELQTKLLRVLQEREFERLGSTRTLRTDARLIAATNRDLSAMVEAQEFRADLFYRLHVFPVCVPPLRERREDIPLLVRHFVKQFARQMQRTIASIPSATMEALLRYPWPGNIRELQNCIERAVILSPGPVLQVPLDDLRPHAIPSQESGKLQTLEESDRALILATLKETKWVLGGPGGAAVRLGLNRSTLAFRMKKLGIARPWQ